MSTSTAAGSRILFFTDAAMNSMTRAMLGRVYTGAADTGETLTTIDRITDGDLASWAREWAATADRVAAIGDDCVRRGHRVSGRNALLRAATYYAACVLVVDACEEPDAVRARTFAAYRRCWEQYLRLLDNPPEPLEIPYEDTTMPGWFFAAPGNGPKPTLIMVNGADGAASYLWPGYGSEASVRGYNVVIFDGPGQQRMLFEKDIHFRPDWEHVVTPVVDATLRLPGVDADRLALYAVSQGGYWAPRALAFEHRFAAAVIDDGVVSLPEGWHAMLPPNTPCCRPSCASCSTTASVTRSTRRSNSSQPMSGEPSPGGPARTAARPSTTPSSRSPATRSRRNSPHRSPRQCSSPIPTRTGIPSASPSGCTT